MESSPQWWIANTYSMVKSQHNCFCQTLHIAISSSALRSNWLWRCLLINLLHKMAWWSWLGNWILEWDEKSKTENEIVLTEILQHFFSWVHHPVMFLSQKIFYISPFLGDFSRTVGPKEALWLLIIMNVILSNSCSMPFSAKSSKTLVKA